MAAGWRARPAGRRCRTARRATKTRAGAPPSSCWRRWSRSPLSFRISVPHRAPTARSLRALVPWDRRRNRFAPHATTDRCPSPSGPSRSPGSRLRRPLPGRLPCRPPAAGRAWDRRISRPAASTRDRWRDSRPRLRASSGRHPGRAAAQPTEPARRAPWRRRPPAAHAAAAAWIAAGARARDLAPAARHRARPHPEAGP